MQTVEEMLAPYFPGGHSMQVSGSALTVLEILPEVIKPKVCDVPSIGTAAIVVKE